MVEIRQTIVLGIVGGLAFAILFIGSLLKILGDSIKSLGEQLNISSLINLGSQWASLGFFLIIAIFVIFIII
ncbi:MAG: hypothetical protein QXF82_04480, partial [Nitrososphaeria archaeon]